MKIKKTKFLIRDGGGHENAFALWVQCSTPIFIHNSKQPATAVHTISSNLLSHRINAVRNSKTTVYVREDWILRDPQSSSFRVPRNLSYHMDRKARTGDTALVRSREMTGRSQTLPCWQGGEGVKTTENQLHWPRCHMCSPSPLYLHIKYALPR